MTVYKRGEVYYMDFVIDGKRVYKSTKQTTKTMALKAEQKEKDKLKEQRNRREFDSMTLKEAIEDVYMDRWEGQKSGEQTYKRLLMVCQEVGNPPLDEINGKFVQGLKRWSKQKGHKEATTNRYLAHLKTVLLVARDEWEVLERVPKISLTKEQEGRIRVITREELEKMTDKLRAVTDNSRRSYWPLAADLFEVLIDTGMRLSEALNLTRDNFTNDGHIKLYPAETKSKRPRIIPMTERVKEIIDRLGYDEPFKDIDNWKAERAFKWTKKQLKVTDPDFCIHALRHSFASNLLNKGADIYTVQKLLGHASPVTTQRYGHLQTKTLTNAVDLLQ